MTEKQETESINDLIEQLEKLQLQRKDINERLQRQENNIIDKIQLCRRQEKNFGPKAIGNKQQDMRNKITTVRQGATGRQNIYDFQQGDEVKITNKVGYFLGPKPTPEDRIKIVPHMTDKKVWFTTRSNIETWRAPSNLRIINKK